ncbi:MAG: AAA family ATPase [Thermoleophilaceae bacterium]
MHSKIIRPGTVNTPPRLLIYSRAKKGKTLLTATAGQGKILLLDSEHGTEWMKTTRLNPHVWPIEDWGEIEEFVQYVRSTAHSYAWISVDSLTSLIDLALKYILRISKEVDLSERPTPVSAPKRGSANELVMTMMARLYRADVGIIYTARERVISNTTEIEGDKALLNGVESENTESEETPLDTPLRYVPDLPDQLRRYAVGQTELIGRLYVVQVQESTGGGGIVTKNQRRLWVAPHDAYDTGYRAGYVLPQYISKPTIPKIVALLERGKLE